MRTRNEPIQADSDFISAAEVAAALGISRQTLSSYVRHGLVKPSVTLPSGHVRWTRSDIERLRSAGAA